MEPPEHRDAALDPSRGRGRLLHRPRRLRHHHQSRLAAVLRDRRHPGGVGVEDHAHGRRCRHLGRRAHPVPARPRGHPVHGVLGISDRVPASPRRAGDGSSSSAPATTACLWPSSALLGAGRSLADWFSARPAPVLTAARASAIGWILRVTTALLLIGHGAFDVVMHKDWTWLRRRHRHQPGHACGASAHTAGRMVRVRARSARPRLARAWCAARRRRVEARHRSPAAAGR